MKSQKQLIKKLLKVQEWQEYHKWYREARKTLSIIPYGEIIKRIKHLSPRLQIGDFVMAKLKS